MVSTAMLDNTGQPVCNPDSPDRAESPALCGEVQAKLTPAEIGTLQAIFKLDVQ